jgi:hypothetical protein
MADVAALKKDECQTTAGCGCCHAHKPSMKVCAACKAAWYCSVECQKACWSKHKALCVWLREAVSSTTAATIKTGEGTSPEAVTDIFLEQFGDAWLHETLGFFLLC